MVMYGNYHQSCKPWAMSWVWHLCYDMPNESNHYDLHCARQLRACAREKFVYRMFSLLASLQWQGGFWKQRDPSR